jgi:phosphocarrier protein
MSRETAIKQTAVVGSRVGLHVRPAGIIAKAAAGLEVPVRIGREGRDPVDARSPLLLIALGASCGDAVVIESDGPGASEAVAAIVALVESDLDAPS